jgi:hypothetical protein
VSQWFSPGTLFSSTNKTYHHYIPGNKIYYIVESGIKHHNPNPCLLQLKEFLSAQSDLGPGARAFEQAIENTESNIRWMNKNYDAIKNWLNVQDRSKEAIDVRLPRAVIPKMYTLTLRPDFYGTDPATFSTEGTVSIEMDCVQETSNITLHILKLTIDVSSVNINSPDHVGTLPGVVNLSEDEERQFLIVNLNENLQPGKTYVIEMSFTGPLSSEALAGFYLSSYKRGDQTM